VQNRLRTKSSIQTVITKIIATKNSSQYRKQFTATQLNDINEKTSNYNIPLIRPRGTGGNRRTRFNIMPARKNFRCKQSQCDPSLLPRGVRWISSSSFHHAVELEEFRNVPQIPTTGHQSAMHVIINTLTAKLINK